MSAQADHRRALEQLPAVVEHAEQALLDLPAGAGQLELRDPQPGGFRRMILMPGCSSAPFGVFSMVNITCTSGGRLKSRSGASSSTRRSNGSSWCDVGGERRLTHPGEEIAEARIAAEVRPQHQRVDEEADQRSELGPDAAGDRRRHGEIVLPGVALQDDEEAGQQRHEERRLMAAGERLKLRERRRIHEEGPPGSPRAADRLPRVVGRQLQDRRHAGQPAAPPAELRLQTRAGQPAALPDGEIRILDGQLRQRARLAGEKRRIERSDLTHQHAHRPAVAHDVMHHENEQVLVVGAAEHAAAQQRVRFRGRTAGGSPARTHPPDLWIPPRGRQGAEVDHGQPRHEARRDHLHRLAVLGGGERGAQGLMAVGHARERKGQRRQVESPEDARRRRQVVGRIAGMQTVEEPEPELAERKGKRSEPVLPGLDAIRCPLRRPLLAQKVAKNRLLGGRKSGELVLRLSHRSSISPRELLPRWGNKDDRRSGRARASASGAVPWGRDAAWAGPSRRGAHTKEASSWR